jgi:hypothetical protein
MFFLGSNIFFQQEEEYTGFDEIKNIKFKKDKKNPEIIRINLLNL